jgi:hypothetical protein
MFCCYKYNDIRARKNLEAGKKQVFSHVFRQNRFSKTGVLMENVHVWIGGQNPTQNATVKNATTIKMTKL